MGKLRSEDSDYTFDGKLDELRIWNKTLTASEVSQQYMSNLYKHSSDGWNLEVNQTKNVTDVLENGTYTYQAFATDTSGNLNMTEERTITIGATPTDTCTYSGSGNWNVNCWDNCSIDTSVNLLGNNLWINGTGIFNVLSTIYNYDRIELINDCKLQIINNGNIF